jgi:hypothetical protein
MNKEINQILDLLEYVASKKRSISLVSTFKGVSISSDVIINEISNRRKTVTMLASPGHEIPFFPSTMVIIRCVLFPKPVRANVAAVDFNHRKIKLNNFAFAKGSMGKRSQTRVQPEGTLKARLTRVDNVQHSGEVADISLEGIAVFLDQKGMPLERMIKSGDRLDVNFYLPLVKETDSEHISMPARVVYVNPLDEPTQYRVGMQTYPSNENLTILRKYLFDRQTEVFSSINIESGGN